jgi:hypothetical protein
MDNATPPDPAPLSPGRRIKFWRERQGMTREVLGGLRALATEPATTNADPAT